MITYRKAEPGDTHALAAIRGDYLVESGYATEENKDAVVELNKIYFGPALRNGSFVAWLAMDGQSIAATSGLTFSLVPPNGRCLDGRVAYIMNMYTLPAYRRQGIAKEVFRRILNEAKQRGFHKITLSATDMGRSLYERFGFQPVEGDMALLTE